MGYAPDGSLQDRLDKDGPLPIEDVASYLSQAALALDHIHQAGIIHCDVKPSNFLLNGSTVMLSDFGIGHRTTISTNDDRSASTLSDPGHRGTALYVAPEQGLGKQVDKRADIYALGITLYQMVTGNVPFDGSGGKLATILKHINEQPPPLPSQFSYLNDVVMRALSKQPKDRYQSAGALAGAFCKALGPLCPSCKHYSYGKTKTFCMRDGTRLLFGSMGEYKKGIMLKAAKQDSA